MNGTTVAIAALLFLGGVVTGQFTMGAITGDHCPGVTTHPEQWPLRTDERIGSWDWCQDAFARAMENTTAN